MATGPTRTEVPLGPARRGGRREARLAELVAELTACDDDLALDAVRTADRTADPLELVARAMTRVRRRELEPQDRLRVAGFLRAGERRLPRRTRSATALAESPDADQHLVHHGSLRRWERTGDVDLDDPGDIDDEVIDLRDRTARFRRPGPAAPDLSPT